MKRITVVVDDRTALVLMGLLADKVIISLSMEPVGEPNGSAELRGRNRNMHPGTTLHDTLYKAFPLQKNFTLQEAEEVIEKEGYVPSGAQATLSTLVGQGFVKREGYNFYFDRPLPPHFKLKGKATLEALRK